MVHYDQAWIVGGIFTLAAVMLIASLMRESIPYGVRRGAQVSAFLAVLALAAFAAIQSSPGMRSVSWSLPVLETPQPPTPVAAAPKASPKRTAAEFRAAPNLNKRLKVGTMREVTPEEAQSLLANKPRP
ncbi:MAG: hypothetical protein ABIR70_00255 [Bryobacteraceae bacterium]